MDIKQKKYLLELEIQELKQKKKPPHLIEEAELELKRLNLTTTAKFALDNLNNKDKLN